jgi:hypothetical protein
MNISSTKITSSLARRPARAAASSKNAESPDSLSSILVQRFATDPVPKSSKLGVILPAVGGAALGGAAGLIGEGLGGGASIPGIAILGLAGAAVGSKIDGDDGSKWTRILGAAGAVVGSAGVVAGALGGVPGAIAGGVSMAGTGFALGHLFQHFTE